MEDANQKNMFKLFLRYLEELGISTENRDMLQKLFGRYQKYHFSAEDCAELAFARLRADSIEIISPVKYQPLFLIEESSDSFNFEEQFSVSLPWLAKRLFDELGVIAPKFVLSLSEDADVFSVKINDYIIPLSLADEPSSDVLREMIYDILVRHVAQLISIDDIEYHLARLREIYPVLVQAVLARYTRGDITRILRDMARKGTSIQDIRFPLERLLDSSFAAAIK
ncbi:MAG TPA: hypothetical protein VFA09_04630 [Ktedonobacteraceae bacterium]|nr:hypothetical protein [Ktedonobacteraceae bacterium]